MRAVGESSPPFFDSEATMRSLLVCSILTIGLSWAQHSMAAEKKHSPKAIAPKQVILCDESISDTLHKLSDKAGISISKPLSDKQYDFLKAQLKKAPPGDGAFFIALDGGFLVALTKGVDDDARFCAVMAAPIELIAAIIETDQPKDKPKSDQGGEGM